MFLAHQTDEADYDAPTDTETEEQDKDTDDESRTATSIGALPREGEVKESVANLEYCSGNGSSDVNGKVCEVGTLYGLYNSSSFTAFIGHYDDKDYLNLPSFIERWIKSEFPG